MDIKNNLRILYRNEEEMTYSRAVQKFIIGIECPLFLAGKDYIWVSDSHKNDFAKATSYLASFIRHSKDVYQQILGFNTREILESLS